MWADPQEGLRALRRAHRIVSRCTTSSARFAPSTKACVTSVPERVTRRASPRSTSAPLPPTISAGSLGTDNPPATSGHTITNRPSRCHLLRASLTIPLDAPS